MTIADKAVDKMVERFYNDMNDQKKGFRGPNFDERTFDIEKHVDVHLFLYYRDQHRLTQSVREKAKKRARKLWNKLWNII